MAEKRVGKQTIALNNPPIMISHHCTVGPVEGQGPLASYFDDILDDDLLGQSTPEKAELAILEQTINKTLSKNRLSISDIQYYIAGDLLNQIISANFSARSIDTSFLGIYSACATFTQGLGLGALLIDGGYADKVLAATSSHYQTAERQFRYPIELNIKRKLTNQHTVTGASAVVLANAGEGPKITEVTFGKVIDFGIKDVNDMGSAMAPAAIDTLRQHLEDTGRTIGDYDLILTGDLSRQGKKMFSLLAKDLGLSLGEKYQDAGVLIYNPQQPVGAGGSGCACSAVVTIGYLLKEMVQGKFKKVLVIATGALTNSLTYQQGESVPGVAHGIVIEA